MKSFFYEMNVISYVFLNTDFGKNTQQILAQKVSAQMEKLCVVYCWMPHREKPQAVHKRKSSKRNFEEKKKIIKIFDIVITMPINNKLIKCSIQLIFIFCK